MFSRKRVCLSPDAVYALVNNGHRVLVESGAGEHSNFIDKDYSESGASITNDTKKVFSCPIVLKVTPPSLSEVELMNPQTLLISTLQLKVQKKAFFEALSKKRITALAFEFIKGKDSAYPAVKALEIAGTASIASELQSNSNGGTGLSWSLSYSSFNYWCRYCW